MEIVDLSAPETGVMPRRAAGHFNMSFSVVLFGRTEVCRLYPYHTTALIVSPDLAAVRSLFIAYSF